MSSSDRKQQPEEALKELITEVSHVRELLFEARSKTKKPSWRFHHSVRKPELVYREKPVEVQSDKHLQLLRQTLEHLEALRDVYQPSSANRHILSQAIGRIKRLVNRLEKKV